MLNPIFKQLPYSLHFIPYNPLPHATALAFKANPLHHSFSGTAALLPIANPD
jgi:hypothetical protein